MAKKTVFEMLDQLSSMINNREMGKWAENFDKSGHGAKAAATHIRVNLAAVMKEAKAIRAEIQDRKAKL